MAKASLETAKGRDILVINGGSSSIKFAIYQTGPTLARTLFGKIERSDPGDARLTFHDDSEAPSQSGTIVASNHESLAMFLIDWLSEQIELGALAGVGHRVVHGMSRTEPELVTPTLLKELSALRPIDPEHLPGEIALIETLQSRCPKVSQVVCFDTAFHQTMPEIAKLLPIPRRFQSQGIQRYGFHGLSYAYLMQELARLDQSVAMGGRVILAHLGNGASVAAVKDGKSIDTSMGFTPVAGLPMGTRSGDLDPGLFTYLTRSDAMTTTQFQHMVCHESGLLGLSETSADVRVLLDRESHDRRAADALELFCYQTKKWIGAFAAALGGLDTLVFTGGIGENSATIRARICTGLGFLGIELGTRRNLVNHAVISKAKSRVTVRAIATDEQRMIADSVCRLLDIPHLR